MKHDRENVKVLQRAHADHIRSLYRTLAATPGNPHGVVIREIGDVRTFIAAGNRLENRAIFSGEETIEQIDEVLAHFAAHRSNCVIEVNPANYYVDPPKSWEQRLLKHLLSRGCFIDGFRCVWQFDRSAKIPVPEVPGYRVVKFDCGDRDKFEQLKRIVESSTETARQIIPRPRPEDGWLNYVVFNDTDVPCAVGTLYAPPRAADLSWWFTHPAHRCRGLQQLGILRRVRDALERGSRRIFTVTDFNFSSPANLQRCGFRLAYNYLLVRKDAGSS